MEAMITSNGCGTVVRFQSNSKYKLNKTAVLNIKITVNIKIQLSERQDFNL